MDTEATKESRGAPVLAASIVLFFLVIACVVPKVIWQSPGFIQRIGTLGADAFLLFSPVSRVVIVLLGLLTLRIAVRRRPSYTLGFRVGWKRFLFGSAFAIACTLPMGLLAILSDPTLAARFIAHTTLVPGLNEEFVFRAFAFGLLVRAARWRVWPAAILTGVIFGLIHVNFTPPEGQTILGQVFSFWILLIAIGGVTYAWLFYRSGWNLWLVIWLHTMMNFWWDAFNLNSSSLGGGGATAARIATVAIAITTIELVHNGVIRGPFRLLVGPDGKEAGDPAGTMPA